MQGDASLLATQAQNLLKRRRKEIKARAKFKAHGDNPLKSYCCRFTDYQVMVRAKMCRQQRLCSRTRAEMAFSEMLDSLRILYQSQAIFQKGDRFIIADFYFKAQKLVIEIDGSAHDGQKQYDAGEMLLRTYGERTIRFSNRQVLVEGANVLAAVLNVLKLS